MFILNLGDLDLLLAVVSIFLLIASELLSPQYGRVNLLVSRKKLRRAALFMSALFIYIVAIRVIGITIGG